jgi:hypothetical protein
VSRQNLTDRFINSRRNAAPGKRDDYPDAIVPGLALRVTDRGHKSFVLVPGIRQIPSIRPGERSVMSARSPSSKPGRRRECGLS